MCFKAMMMAMMVMVMLVMPVYPRPHQAPNGIGKIENAVSESLKEIETAIMGSAKKIKSAIEETVLDKMAEVSASRMGQHSNAAAIGGDSALPEVNIKKNIALKYNLGKILVARKAAALKGVAAPSVLGNAKVAEGETTAPNITTTTMDPWDEYCQEACEAGIGGPECDCPDHPIG